MAKIQPVKILPVVPPPARGPRARLATEIAALEVGGNPVSAPLKERNRVAMLARYWSKRLGHTYTTRRMDGLVVVWRIT